MDEVQKQNQQTTLRLVDVVNKLNKKIDGKTSPTEKQKLDYLKSINDNLQQQIIEDREWRQDQSQQVSSSTKKGPLGFASSLKMPKFTPVQSAYVGVLSFLTNAGKGAVDLITAPFRGILEDISTVVEGILSFFKNLITNIINAVVNVVSNALKIVKSLFETVGAGIRALLTGIGQGLMAFIPFLTFLMNPLAMAALAVFTVSIIGLAAALKIAEKPLIAFANVIGNVLVTAITAISNVIIKLIETFPMIITAFSTLKLENIGAMLALAAALPVLTMSLLTFGPALALVSLLFSKFSKVLTNAMPTEGTDFSKIPLMNTIIPQLIKLTINISLLVGSLIMLTPLLGFATILAPLITIGFATLFLGIHALMKGIYDVLKSPYFITPTDATTFNSTSIALISILKSLKNIVANTISTGVFGLIGAFLGGTPLSRLTATSKLFPAIREIIVSFNANLSNITLKGNYNQFGVAMESLGKVFKALHTMIRFTQGGVLGDISKFLGGDTKTQLQQLPQYFPLIKDVLISVEKEFTGLSLNSALFESLGVALEGLGKVFDGLKKMFTYVSGGGFFGALGTFFSGDKRNQLRQLPKLFPDIKTILDSIVSNLGSGTISDTQVKNLEQISTFINKTKTIVTDLIEMDKQAQGNFKNIANNVSQGILLFLDTLSNTKMLNSVEANLNRFEGVIDRVGKLTTNMKGGMTITQKGELSIDTNAKLISESNEWLALIAKILLEKPSGVNQIDGKSITTIINNKITKPQYIS
jgi:hypothetical protein